MAIVSAATSVLLRTIGYVLPVLMAISVVVTANHYILDVVAGDLPRPHRTRGGPASRAAAGAEETAMSSDRVLAIAHRAGNSLHALHLANELGVDVIEADVFEHRGRLEVRHLKTAGPLPFLWDKWELVPASRPRLGLAELLEADRHGTTFMLDLKSRRTSAAQAIAEFLHDNGHHQPVLVCGRYWPAVDALAALPFVRPVPSARNRIELALLRPRLSSGSAPMARRTACRCTAPCWIGRWWPTFTSGSSWS